ncbi:MAG: DNA polymerase III subunit delta' [Syntrophobacteraceae bacterium CG2_30_61_12]|nr:MAG: DNA polymerase III subunit delta' [Syntrophobacteraceae bacterium CG2_30_61_12]
MALGDLPAQDRVKRFLGLLVRTGRLPHALLFSGLPGIGKKAAALEFAKLVNCLELPERPGPAAAPPDCCDVCASCHKITAGTHPDLIRIARDGTYIKLAQIQELRGRLRYNPVAARRRVIIIEDAQDLKEEAGNALLKLLEEPPRRNLFLLLAPEPQMLLGTIVSRCCHLRFQPLPEAWIERRLIEDHQVDQAAAAHIARLSGGSLSQARLWAEPDRLARRQEVFRRIGTLKGQSMMDFFALTEKWAKEDGDLEQDLDCIKFWLRELLHSRIRKSSSAGQRGPGELRDLGAGLAAEAIFRLHAELDRACRGLRRFANKQLTLEGVLLTLKEVLDG